MAIAAIWSNPERTTFEVSIDGVTSYVVKTMDGELQGDDPTTIAVVREWLDEGNQPEPGNFGE